MYPHRYKFGKQKTILPLVAFEAAMQDAINRGESLENLAYVTLLWHTGVRKSEAYERVLDDVRLSGDAVTVDFYKRKKHGEEVPPLKIPRAFYGVEEYLVPWVQERVAAKPPHKTTAKTLFAQAETGENRTTPKGKVVTVKKPSGTTVKAQWLFPNIASTKAWIVVKRVLGKEFYPHYLRLRKLSAIGRNPQTKSLIHIKAVSGLKSVSAIGSYLGFDQEAQDEAMKGSE